MIDCKSNALLQPSREYLVVFQLRGRDMGPVERAPAIEIASVSPGAKVVFRVEFEIDRHRQVIDLYLLDAGGTTGSLTDLIQHSLGLSRRGARRKVQQSYVEGCAAIFVILGPKPSSMGFNDGA